MKARRCWRIRRRVEELEKAVFSIWGHLRYLWQTSGREPLILPEEPLWMKRLKKYRAAAPHPPCGGERPSGREMKDEMSVEKRRKMFLKWLFKRGYSEKELEPLPTEVAEKAMSLFNEAVDVADSLTNVLGELADLFEEAGRPGLARKCRSISVTVKAAAVAIKSYAEIVEGMVE